MPDPFRVGDRGRPDVGVGLLVLAVATSPWNAVGIGSLKLTHLFLALAVAVLLVRATVARRPVFVPGWVWLLGAAIALTAVLSLVWPPTAAYLAGRFADGVPDVSAGLASPGPDNVVGGLKWLVVELGLPLGVCLAAATRPARVGTLAVAWVAGTTLSATVAITDQLGVTRIGGILFPAVSFTSRQAGLSVHSNHLALSIVMSLPVVVWLLARRRGTALVLPALAAVLMTVGVVVSGSRAGYVGAALAVVLTMAAEPRARRLLPWAAAAGVLAALGAVAVLPGTARAIGKQLRLVDNDGAVASDEVRAGLNHQALVDAVHSPIHGLGYQILAQGHDIYLQLLASGGILLFLGYVLAQLGFLGTAWRVPDATGIGRALGIAGATFLLIGVVENQLADVFVHVPFALVAGLWAASRHASLATPAPPGVDQGTPSPEREEIPA
ncbi:MAG: hypothetical protein QOE59_4645 [Actinomycetota bacterium]|jgi:hypothetical protein|nr:hypothetical protein [Actinomycetota bacterium]